MTPRPAAIRVLRYTPMRDMVRLRFTGRLDLGALLERSALPAPAAECVRRVVHRTRLWRLEKIRVAEELIAHFQDGLASGARCDELLTFFGDENKTAILIRRATKRQRPLAWHAARACAQGMAALVILYVGIAIYIYSGRPTITTDYMAQLNQQITSVPRDQTAWPLYAQALLTLKFDGPEYKAVQKQFYAYDGARWDALEAFAKAHAEELTLIRRGAAKPKMGLVVTT